MPAPASRPARRRHLVWHAATAVDGDTIRLEDGQDVRVVGIDTPEVGQCGSARAAAVTARLVAGGVRLRRAKGENRDRYDRLLRSVVTRHGDLGTALLKRGLAIARYDSTDGYGWHPLEDRYHRIDAAVPQRCPSASQRRPRPASGRCDPNYRGACVPRVPYDLDCDDVSGPVRIVGVDRYGFDGDGDGRACEH